MDDLVPLQLGLSGLANILFACVVGTLACFSWLGNGNTPELERQLLKLLRTCATALLMADGLYLWLQAAVMGDTSLTEAGPAIWMVLASSHYGKTWLISTAGLILTVSSGFCRQSRVTWATQGLGLALYAFGRAASSHAANSGEFSMAEMVQWLHLCATGLWSGGVMVGGFAVVPTLVSDHTRLVAFTSRLSRGATHALVLVIVSGLYNIQHITSLIPSTPASSLTSSHYGHVFAIKTLLVLIAIVLAGANREIFLPALIRSTTAGSPVPNDNGRSTERFSLLLRLEAWIMMFILCAATVLGHSSPYA